MLAQRELPTGRTCPSSFDSGVDALASVGEFGASIIFCDIGMPGMNGCEVARRLPAERASDKV